MAAQNRKSASGRGRGTAQRSNSSGKRNSGRNHDRDAQGPDLLTIIVVLVAIVLVLFLVSKYNKEKEGGEVLQPTGEVSATQTPDTATPEGTETQTPEPTKAVTKAPKPETTATPEPTPTEEPVLTEKEAKTIVKKIIQLDKYSIELLDDHLMIEGAEYFAFCINDEKGEAMSPLLIVNRKDGTLLCYDMTGVVAPIEKFPLDNTETGNEGVKTLSEEEAKKVLTGYSGAALGLAKEPGAYDITVDDWTTNVGGIECYGFNMFETVNNKQRFRGIFYVAMDGSAVYSKDEVSGEFIKR